VHDRLSIARSAADEVVIEAVVGLETYIQRDQVEDHTVRQLFARLREHNAANPSVIAMLDAWQRAWEAADAAADAAAERMSREIHQIADELRIRLAPSAATALPEAAS
jgi:urease accessory protein UreF